MKNVRSVVSLSTSILLLFLSGFNFMDSYAASGKFGYFETPCEITEDVIAYDGNPSVYLPDLTEPGTCFDVRFTPVEACSLVAVEVVTYLRSGDGIIHIFADSAGIPGDDLITPLTATLWGNLARQRIDLPSPIDVDSADFHVAVEYAQVPPPYAALDNNGGTGRSSYKAPGGDWTVIHAHDLNIRAYVNYYTVDDDPPTIECLPRVLGFSVEESYEIIAEITDISGVLSASVFYSEDSLNYAEIVMTNVSGDTWSVEIPSQPVGSTVYYYVVATDNSQNQNTGMFPAGGPDNPFTLLIVDGHEISYDDGSPESFWIVGSTWDNNKFGLRMTPDEYPIRITGARVMVDDATPFNITINEDNSGIPGALVTGPYEIFRNAEDWAILFIPEAQQPQFDQGDFWVVFHWRINSPGSPGVGIDNFSPDCRSKRYTDTGGWISVDNADFIMRAFGVSMTSLFPDDPGARKTPSDFALLDNYPNPFNSSTLISFMASVSGYARLEIFDPAGRKVRTLIDGNIDAGKNAVFWDGRDDYGNPVSSGIYFFRLRSETGSQVKKMTLIK
jgi:hypothetical protein